VDSDGRVRESMTLLRQHNVSGRRQKPTGLPFQRQLLGDQLPSGERGNREEAANSKFVDGAKIHLSRLRGSTVACLR